MESWRWKPLPPEVTGAARDLAEELRALLDDAGLTLRGLAAHDDVPSSPATLHRYFAGKTLPSRRLLTMIAARCGAGPEDLDELLTVYDRARRERFTPQATPPPRRPNRWVAARQRPFLVATSVVAFAGTALALTTITTTLGGPGDEQGLPAPPAVAAMPPTLPPTQEPSLGPSPEPSPAMPPKANRKRKAPANRTPEPGVKPSPPPPSSRETPHRQPQPPERQTTPIDRPKQQGADPQRSAEQKPISELDPCDEQEREQLERRLEERYGIGVTIECGSGPPVPLGG